MAIITDKNTVNAVAKTYVSNGRNREAALVSVGYSKSYANKMGKLIWERPEVIDAILREERRSAARIDVSTDEIIKELRRYAFVDDGNALVANTSERIRALELLGKRKGMWVDVSLDHRLDLPKPKDDAQAVADSERRRLQLTVLN